MIVLVLNIAHSDALITCWNQQVHDVIPRVRITKLPAMEKKKQMALSRLLAQPPRDSCLKP